MECRRRLAAGSEADRRAELQVRQMWGLWMQNVSRETFLVGSDGPCFTWNILFFVQADVFHVKHFLEGEKGDVSRETFTLMFKPQCFT
jgi:hypothetical protein